MDEDAVSVEPEEIKEPEVGESPLDAEIDAWFQRSFNSTALGHHTEIWNLVLRATDDLKLRLAALHARS